MPTLGTGLGLVSPPRTQLFTPVPGTITRLSANHTSPYGSATFTGHTSAAGNVLVVFATRAIPNSPGGFSSVTWGGSALTESVDEELDIGTSKAATAHVWAGFIDNGPTGSQSIVITPANSTDFQDIAGFAISVDRLLASPYGASPVPGVVRTVQSAYGVPIVAVNSASLLISFVAAMDENLAPFGISADWTLRDQFKTGNGGTGDIACVLGTRLAGAAGSYTMLATSTAAGTPSTDDWCAVALELLPAD